jgi:hypothetical protein
MPDQLTGEMTVTDKDSLEKCLEVRNRLYYLK